MAEFRYQPLIELGEDKTEYYLLTKDYVSVSEFEGKPILKVEKEGLRDPPHLRTGTDCPGTGVLPDWEPARLLRLLRKNRGTVYALVLGRLGCVSLQPDPQILGASRVIQNPLLPLQAYAWHRSDLSVDHPCRFGLRAAAGTVSHQQRQGAAFQL